MKLRTRAIHIGNQRDPQTGAVVPPIHMASTFVQPGAGDWGEFDYSRSGNPTRKNLETTLASLESGCGALAFSSGMAATHCVTMLLNRVTGSWPARIFMAGPIGCCTKSSIVPVFRFVWLPAPIWTISRQPV